MTAACPKAIKQVKLVFDTPYGKSESTREMSWENRLTVTPLSVKLKKNNGAFSKVWSAHR